MSRVHVDLTMAGLNGFAAITFVVLAWLHRRGAW